MSLSSYRKVMIRSFFLSLFFAFLLTACGNPTTDKMLSGKWLQDIPTSTTQNGMEVTTLNTVLEFEKDGDVLLRRQIEIRGINLPNEGISLDIDLSGQWRLEDGTLIQTLEEAWVTPRNSSQVAKNYANQLQDQAAQTSETQKTILVLNNKELILQDLQTGFTDTYRRK